MQPELLLEARAELGEGPAWDARTGLLSWVDIHAGQLHLFDPQDGIDRSLSLGEPVGCAAPRKNGGLILALRSGFALLDPPLLAKHPRKGAMGEGRGARVSIIVNPEPGMQGNRFNDGKCDPAGRFLAGSMDDAEKEATGSLYSLAPDGMLKTLLSGLRISNGLAWSPDTRTFYHIDTPTRQVRAYAYDLESGGISRPRPVVTVPPELGWPDGMTSDSEGKLWVAMWAGAKVARWDPASGRLLEEFPLPAFNVSSCAFGGEDLTDLYVTTARKGMSAAQLEQYPLTGSLFRIRTGIRGMPAFAFGG
jgi:sugar lactone lactonase YvrE